MTDTTKKVGKIYGLIPKIMADIGAIGKGQKNKMQNYKFRGIDDVYNAVQPSLITHGVFCVPQVLETSTVDRKSSKGGTLIYVMHKVRYTFYADDGSFVEAIVSGEAMDSGDKASNKAMSAAMKYALFQVFCIPTEGDHDTESHSHEIVDQKPATPKPDVDINWLKGEAVVKWMQTDPAFHDANDVIRYFEREKTLSNECHSFVTELFGAQGT